MTRSTSEHLIPNVRWWALLSSALCPVLLIAGWTIADAVQPDSYSLTMQTSWPFAVVLSARHAMRANRQPALVLSV